MICPCPTDEGKCACKSTRLEAQGVLGRVTNQDGTTRPILPTKHFTEAAVKQYGKSRFNKIMKAAKQFVTEGQFWHADHKRPVADGGGSCGRENIQTLCVLCHAFLFSRPWGAGR